MDGANSTILSEAAESCLTSAASHRPSRAKPSRIVHVHAFIASRTGYRFDNPRRHFISTRGRILLPPIE
jgi:hypothetical protein